MSRQITQNFLKLSSDNIELEHVYSISENHHVFHVIVMGIKYKIEYLNGDLLSINYHDDYKDCFTPLKKNQSISDIIIIRVKSILSFYFNENKWLQGWSRDWKKLYSNTWRHNMKKEPEALYFKCNKASGSISYFSYKNNTLFQIL